MVQVKTLRKSSRRAISSSVMPGSIFLAASSTCFGYLYGRPYCASMACISTLLSPSLPSTSMTSPTMFFDSFDGHCVIFTTAFSPSLPPFSFFFGIRMSCTKMLPSVMRKAKSFSTFSLPTAWSVLWLRISVTIASLMWFCRRAIRATFTRSPFRANIELRSDTKMGVPPPSGRNVFLPLALRRNVPSCTCPF